MNALLLFPLLLWGCRAAWTDDAQLRALAARQSGITPRTITVDLDRPPKERWSDLASDPLLANYKHEFVDYLSHFVPKGVIPLVAGIVRNLRKSFYDDYADEMEGLAQALNVTLGDVVLVNLIYQVEDIGITCSKRNTTGPCPPKQQDGPGLCTAALVDDGVGAVWQGRNLDWNLEESLLDYVVRVEYRRGNNVVFTGVQVIGEIGVIHGMRSGAFSVQLNARNTGGNIIANLAQLALGAKTPTHVMRRALETAENFNDALQLLADERLANPVYFTMAGASQGQGAIITRDRTHVEDVWHLHEESPKDTGHINDQPGWLRLQTNYDHWKPVPAYDDRRTPAVANVQRLCNSSIGQACMRKVMTAWPTLNHHTDVTSIMCPRTGYFDVTVWKQSVEMLVV